MKKMLLLCVLLLSGLLALTGSMTALASSTKTAQTHAPCHIDGVFIESTTRSNHIYLTAKAPSACGKGIQPTTETWKIVVRDASGIRTFVRKHGSATGNIKANGSRADVWAQFTVGYETSSATLGGHSTVYLGQGEIRTLP